MATRQHGVISREQLRELGFTREYLVRALLASRHLVRLHRGVYAVGHRALTDWGRAKAALLSCGEGTVASHITAARLRGILPPPVEPEPVHVSVARKIADRQGIEVHERRSLFPVDSVNVNGVPVTSPERTLLDLAGSRHSHLLGEAFETALVRGLVNERKIRAVLARYPGRRGSRALAKLIEDSGFDRSEAERRMRVLIRDRDLPPPEQNVKVGRFEVDFLWRNEKVIAEVDGFLFHQLRSQFKRDRMRDRELKLIGYTVLRFTWDDIVDEPDEVVATIGAALADRSSAVEPVEEMGDVG